MKIKVQQEKLKQAMTLMALASGGHGDPDSFAVHLQGSAKGLTLSAANDLDGVGLLYTLEAEVVEEGYSDAPCKKLNAIVNNLSGEIRLASKEGKLEVSTPRSKFNLVTTGKESLIDWVFDKDKTLASIAGKELLRALTLTSFAIANKETRYQLSVACLDVAGDTLKATASDGHRMTHVRVPCEAKQEAQLLLRREAIPLLMQLMRLVVDEPIKISQQGYKIVFRSENWELQVGLKEGEYPNYNAILSNAALGEHYAALDREPFIDVVSRMTKACDPQVPSIYLAPTLEALICQSSRDGASAEESFAVAGKKCEVSEVRLNPYYIGQFLRAIDAAAIDIYFPKSNNHPVLFRPAGGGEECQYIVMPLK